MIYNFVSLNEKVIELMTGLDTQTLHNMIWLDKRFISFNFKIKTNNNNNNQNNNKPLQPQQQQQNPQSHDREMDQVSEEMVRSEKRLDSCWPI